MRKIQCDTRRRTMLMVSIVMFWLSVGLVGCSSDSSSGGNPSGSNNGSAANNGDTVNNETPGPNNENPIVDSCGNSVCNEGESIENCPLDCDPNFNNSPGNNNGPVLCGNDVCDEGETSSNCIQDCPPSQGNCDCTVDETCVSNNTVDQVCFATDCDGQACGDGSVCYQGECVSNSCAGLDCGDYPNICRDGACVVGSCDDPDVSCPSGFDCIDDECQKPCDTSDECNDGQACVEGYCGGCTSSAECSSGLLCIDEQCRPPCNDDPSQCIDGEVCDVQTGTCTEPCMETGCGQLEVCNPETGFCEDGECQTITDCPQGHICRDTICTPVGPDLLGMCSGCERSESPGYISTTTVAPINQIGTQSESDAYILQTGTMYIQRQP